MRAQWLLYIIYLAVILIMVWTIWPGVLQAASSTTPTMAVSGIISLYPTNGNVGRTIQISGSNFSKNGSVASVMFGTTNVLLDNAEITDGTFTTYFVVPNVPKSAYAVTVTSSNGNSASSTFTLLPRIELKNNSGRAGDQVVVNGDGFAGTSKIGIYLDYAATPLGTGTTTSSGTITNLAASLTESSAGNHLIRVVDAAGNSMASNFSILPAINVDPVTVISGGETYISGSGFAPSSQISVELDNRLITSYLNTDSKGSLTSTRINLPAVAAGSHTLKVTDTIRNYAQTTLNASCVISLFPKGGVIGSQVTISGSGFLPNKVIKVDYNGKSLSGNSPSYSNADGSFSQTIAVPLTPAGTYSVTASDGINSASSNFMSSPTSGLEINSGAVGASIPISGTGFTAGANVNIKFDGVAIAKTVVDADGSFKTTFQVPARGGGQHKIILTDGINPVTYNFIITPGAQISNSSGSGTQISGYLGSNISISGNAFTPGATVSIRYDTKEIASPTVDSEGSFKADFAAPASRPGKHNVIVSEGTTQFTFVFNMDSTPPSAPMPISPIKDSQNTGLPKFQWTTVSDPSSIFYILQVAAEPSFSSLLIQKTDLKNAALQIGEDEKLPSNKKNQPYYWRVKAIDGVFNESAWSAAYTFTVESEKPKWIWYACGAVGLLILIVGGYLGANKWSNLAPNLLNAVKTIHIPLPKFKKKE
jgi:hypothetical protein